MPITTRVGESAAVRSNWKIAFLKVRCVCGRCNNGWMSDIEAEVKPLLVRFLKGAEVRLQPSEQLRGQGASHERFDIPIPRDGGIQELLERAQSRNRTFDAVICESIDRIARRTYFGTKIEHDLEEAGVALFASDEPIAVNGKRASAILTRRAKQGVAEWYVLELLEKSWDGFREHTKQGWNVGRPPYGYVADRIPHPVPARRAEGRTKSKLAPDPERALVVHQIFKWRVVDRLGYAEIAERLNSDLERYPPLVSPDPARCRDRWSRSSVHEFLANPKYTGYMVWNRRATKKGGRFNPPEAWVWSEEATHEPIVTRELFDAAGGVAKAEQRSRDGVGANTKHPDTKRSYVLRSFVFCELCGHRMHGKTRRQTAYYACNPSGNLGRGAERQYADHPVSIWVREESLLEGVSGSFQNESLDRIAVTFWRPSLGVSGPMATKRFSGASGPWRSP